MVIRKQITGNMASTDKGSHLCGFTITLIHSWSNGEQTSWKPFGPSCIAKV